MTPDCPRVFPGNEVRRTGPGISPVWHYHGEIELNLILAGRGAYFLDSGTHDLSPGTLVWMLPNQSHRLLPEPDLQMWVLTYTGERLESLFLRDVANHANRVLARDDAITLDRLFAHVSQDADEPQLYRAGIDYALRSALHFSMSGHEARQAPLHPAILSAMRVLRASPDMPNAATLAARCGVSQMYLRELLLEQTGRGFVDWRNRFRLERFQILYPDTEDLLTAALAAGFGSYIQFHRVFQSVVGTTPGEWVTGGREVKVAPPIADFTPTPDRSSGRMIWYSLADLVFDDARRWITPEFAACLLSDRDTERPYNPVQSHVIASYDQHRYTEELLCEIDRRDEHAGALLRTSFSRTDLFAANANLLSLWGYDLTDLAPIIATHIITASKFIYRRPIPNRLAVRDFVRRVAAALRASGSFGHASVEDRQRATAALCVQSFILRSAVIGTLNVGTDELMKTIDATARRTMLETYGLDPKPELYS